MLKKTETKKINVCQLHNKMTTCRQVFALIILFYGLASTASQLQTRHFHLKISIN